MRALVTGAGGQLGVELLRTAPADVTITSLAHSELDITDENAVEAAVTRHKPDVIVNAAAYNSVDEAESSQDRAFRINATGPGNLARAADAAGARILHVSTDYVFDGATNAPYKPGDSTNPLNAYGKSKLAGEQEVARASTRSLIVRTSWLFSGHGRNFLQMILAALKAGKPVRAINDQVSVPTLARGLAEVLWLCASRHDLTGIAHWVDAGRATRYEQAVAIREMALQREIIASVHPIESVPSSAFRSAAKRPAFSVMDASALSERLGRKQRPWKDGLREVLDEMR